MDKLLDNKTAKFPASAFTTDYLRETLLLAAQLNCPNINAELATVMKQNVLKADLEALLTLISNELVSRFNERTDEIIAETIDAVLADIKALHPEVDETRMHEWLKLCLGDHINNFEVYFNNGKSEFDSPNFDGAALTITSDYNHLYFIDFENQYDNSQLLDVANEAALHCLHATELDLYSYCTPYEELSSALDNKEINDFGDFYKHKKSIHKAMVDIGMYEEGDLDVESAFESFIDSYAEVVFLDLQNSKNRKSARKAASMFRKHLSEINELETYVHTRPTHALITHSSVFNHIQYSLNLGEEDAEFSVRVPPLKASQLLETVFKNSLILLAIEAYVYYSTPLKTFAPSIIESFSNSDEVEPLRVI
ncbi:hypothetical protein [Vibrio owensii]|uniref:hypothetical protein n=1 Tax=Vibrio owensii TaxID=696485 RepID=UPI0018F26FB3|nr:hypothetical protein [Vibrio owensii]